MKKIILFISLGILTSCSSDDNHTETKNELIVSVDVLKYSNDHTKTILVDLLTNTESNSISFKILSGSGQMNINGQELDQDQSISLESGRTILTFNPSTLGETNIKFLITNPIGIIEERVIQINNNGFETNLPSLDVIENNRTYVPSQNNIQSFKGNYKFKASSQPSNINLSNYIVYHYWTRNINGVSQKYSTTGETGYLVNHQEINYNFSIGDFGQYVITGFYSEIHITDNNNNKSIYTIY